MENKTVKKVTKDEILSQLEILTRMVIELQVGDDSEYEKITDVVTKQFKNILLHKFGYVMGDITTKSRKRELVALRHIYAYILKMKSNLTLKEIAKLSGCTDHSTAHHAIKTVEGYLENQDVFFMQYYKPFQNLLLQSKQELIKETEK